MKSFRLCQRLAVAGHGPVQRKEMFARVQLSALGLELHGTCWFKGAQSFFVYRRFFRGAELPAWKMETYVGGGGGGGVGWE